VYSSWCSSESAFAESELSESEGREREVGLVNANAGGNQAGFSDIVDSVFISAPEEVQSG
jgi:hypothetical protein